MADTVTTQTIVDTTGVKYVCKLTNISDGTGERPRPLLLTWMPVAAPPGAQGGSDRLCRFQPPPGQQ
mgnify:CR=1 FL=1